MSVFTVPIEVSDLQRSRSRRLHAWVDTGAFYSSVPRAILESLGIVAHDREAVELADGRIVENDVGHAWIDVAGKHALTVVMFAEPESQPILGAYTLEGVALAVDARNQRLVPISPLPRFALKHHGVDGGGTRRLLACSNA